jgi:tetratricopeptide (TPR) repeat protein
LASFGIFWFFITLSVESSIIPITDVIFEHRVYLPSVGFFITIVTLVLYWAGSFENHVQIAMKLAVTALVVAAVILTGATSARNTVWRSWETMWQDVKTKSPMKPRAYNNLGAYYVKQEQPVEAIREFEMSVRLDPQYLDSLYNLTMLYVWAGRFREAKQISDTLQKLDPETFKALDAIYGNK